MIDVLKNWGKGGREKGTRYVLSLDGNLFVHSSCLATSFLPPVQRDPFSVNRFHNSLKRNEHSFVLFAMNN